MTIKRLYVIAAFYFILLFLWIILPFSVDQINRIEPYVLGFPFFQFCILLFLVLNMIGLIVLFLLEEQILKRQKKLSEGELS